MVLLESSRKHSVQDSILPVSQFVAVLLLHGKLSTGMLRYIHRKCGLPGQEAENNCVLSSKQCTVW